MLYRSINVAIIILLTWFIFVSLQSGQRVSQQVGALQNALNKSVLSVTENQAKAATQLASIHAHISQQNHLSAEKKSIEKKLGAQRHITDLYAVYSVVLKADLLRSDKQYEQAATLLKSTKKRIWKAGDTYPTYKKQLQGLMQPIDTIVNEWRAKTGSKTAKKIHETLETVLQAKGK